METLEAQRVASAATAGASVREQFDELSSRALNVGRAFASIAPLVNRTKLHSFNARIAAIQLGRDGAAFGVVARSLADLGGELAALAVDVEHRRADVIGALARCARAECWLVLYRRSLGPDALADPHAEPLVLSTGEAWSAARENADRLQARLWDAMLSYRADMLRDVEQMQSHIRRLLRLIDDVDRVAERHGFFIATNAMVEASRLGHTGNDVTSLAIDLRDLIIDIRAGVKVANGEARALVGFANALVAGDVAAAVKALRREREDG